MKLLQIIGLDWCKKRPQTLMVVTFILRVGH